MSANKKYDTTTAFIDEITTAPAAVSFASFAFKLYSSVHKSTTVSTAVFIVSEPSTKKTANVKTPHSVGLIFKIIPSITTIIPATNCILRFLCVLNAYAIPEKAFFHASKKLLLYP